MHMDTGLNKVTKILGVLVRPSSVRLPVLLGQYERSWLMTYWVNCIGRISHVLAGSSLYWPMQHLLAEFVKINQVCDNYKHCTLNKISIWSLFKFITNNIEKNVCLNVCSVMGKSLAAFQRVVFQSIGFLVHLVINWSSRLQKTPNT